MLPIHTGRRTQVVKGEVCKTSMQRFESARRLQTYPGMLSPSNLSSFPLVSPTNDLILRWHQGAGHRRNRRWVGRR
jgi:hypothetical protein